jgi:acyl CoA:acetate/3-ketoacid CoA transferase beta subunit
MNTPNRGKGHVRKDGSHKVVDECTLPLTSRRVVRLIITDLAVGDVPGSPEAVSQGRFHEMNAGFRLDAPS